MPVSGTHARTPAVPDDHDITRGNLCIKGRFGFQHVQPKSNGA
jgi:predicted molibdopterin-dependent oxidoreductase YjgC